MNQEVLNQPILIGGQGHKSESAVWKTFIPAFAAIAGSVAMVLARLNFGAEQFISDAALMMLALACYLTAAVFYLLNFYAPFRLAERFGMWTATLAVFFNLSSWFVRWAAAYDRELATFITQGRTAADLPWLFRYIPFANLYDLSLAFAFGAGITTLVVMRRKQFRIVAAVSLPLAAI